MTNISEKQNKLNNAFLIKSRKIISILVVFFLVMTIMDSVTSAGNIKTEKPFVDDIKDINLTENTKDQINNSIIIDVIIKVFFISLKSFFHFCFKKLFFK